jgi:hypothetical protein
MNSLPTAYSSPVARSTNAIVVQAADKAANDDLAAAPADSASNPLWILAIGMACFFGAAAAVIAMV